MNKKGIKRPIEKENLTATQANLLWWRIFSSADSFGGQRSGKQIKKITELGFVTTDLQELNTRQIEALQNSTERQIAALQDTNAKQITALQELTEKQIEALHKTTYEQISSFEQQIGVVTTKVSDSSILLAEILGRELEKSIDLFTNRVHMEEAKYKNLSEWKLLRTDVEKRAQLTNQWTRIQNIKRGLDYLVDKYNKVKEFLVSGQSK